MDPANGEEAVREALLDVQEGADMVMVKPALAYGDVIAAVKRATRLPVAAYNVSGEYAMVKAAAAAGYLDERATVLEILTSLRRAGADDDHHLPRKGRRAMAGRAELIEPETTRRGADGRSGARRRRRQHPRERPRRRRSAAARTARRSRSTTSTASCST